MKAFLKRRKIFYSKQVKKIDLGKGRNIFNKLVFIINVVFAFLLLLACIAPYITWQPVSFLSFLSLIVPFLVLANILFVPYWLIKRKKQHLMSLTVLLLGYLIQGTFLKVFNSNEEIKDGDIRLLTFNTHRSMGIKRSREHSFGDEIADFIAKQDPDIVCLQEFYNLRTGSLPFNTKYPHIYVNRELDLNNSFRVVQAIFSKYPIVGSGSLSFPNSSNNAIFVDILLRQDTLRVYNIHLQSLQFRAGMIKREEPQRLFKRLDKSFKRQQEQAKLVNDHAGKVGHKKIICGDFNNTQYSSVFNVVKGEMNDTFQEKGTGFGSTYLIKYLPFRIDFILTDPEIEILSHKNFDVRLSDHTPVMASFRLKE